MELIPNLYHLRFPVGHVYLWREADGLTLIDTSLPGSAARIAEAVRTLGADPAEVRRVVLTHFHPDHAGSAAEIATWGAAGEVPGEAGLGTGSEAGIRSRTEICAHHADAPFLRGDRQGPPPDLADWERPLFDQVMSSIPADAPAMPPVRVDVELAGGDVLDFAGGARIVEVAGHTPGSIAIHLTQHGVVITGDAAAARPDGQVMLGVFNADRALAASSFRILAALDADIACFGHGEPVVGGAARALHEVADRLTDS